MTDADVERVARRLCRIRGVDPEAILCHGAQPDPSTGLTPAIALYSPRWKVVEGPEVRAWAEVQQAMRGETECVVDLSHLTPEEREALANAKDGDAVLVKRLS